MNRQKNSPDGYVKKTTMIQFLLIGLVAGFLGGVVFSVYKLDSSTDGHEHDHGPAAQSSQSGQPGQNLAVLEKEVEAHPENAPAWRKLGNAYFDQQMHEKAVQAYETFLDLSPGDPNVLTDLGVMYRRSGKPQKAVETFERAVEIDPDHTQAMFNKGVVLYADLDDREGAIEIWRKIVGIDPSAKAPNGMLVSEVIEQVQKKQ